MAVTVSAIFATRMRVEGFIGSFPPGKGRGVQRRPGRR